MGTVFLAHDATLDRKLALKVLPPEVTSSADRLKRFQREARVVAALNHSHIAISLSVEEPKRRLRVSGRFGRDS